MAINVFVLCGGKSVEHEVSLISAMGIINSLDREKYIVTPIYIDKKGNWISLGVLNREITAGDELIAAVGENHLSALNELLNIVRSKDKTVVFPALHGTFGEDGTVQGLLEMLDIPYVGNGVMSSAIAMDKATAKDLFTHNGIQQCDYIVFNKREWIEKQNEIIKRIEEHLGYPCFVKPARLGSSVGINRAADSIELLNAIGKAFWFDDKIVVEKEVIGREMQISVIGNDYPKASVVGEFIQERQFMDYKAKYLDGKLIQVIEANITESTSKKMRETALRAFEILNCNGLARIDFFVCEGEQFLVNEVNTMPGFTKLSMTPALWEKTDGTTYSELVDKLIEYAFEQFDKKSALKYDRS
ncbi:MAG: D-alanine--D-alanine ligase [Clostridiales bacterium 38_11]|nr:MAG: D-alanine--D-alanine ligase [Clostridiales bacterium 38_11]HBH11814.1 D-alanine--D-alanine ligase [Clostridiales bacterium]